VKEDQRKELLLSLSITHFYKMCLYKFSWLERPETLLHEIPDLKCKAQWKSKNEKFCSGSRSKE
jgi:hypothetical protein